MPAREIWKEKVHYETTEKQKKRSCPFFRNRSSMHAPTQTGKGAAKAAALLFFFSWCLPLYFYFEFTHAHVPTSYF
jgi:hypothetical protein